MDLQTLLAIISYALGPGSAIVVYNVVNWVITQLTDSGHQPSPFGARYITYGASLLVPTVLYLLYIWLAQEPFVLATYILDVLSAFGLSQYIHGQVALPRVPVKVVALTPQEVAAKAVIPAP